MSEVMAIFKKKESTGMFRKEREGELVKSKTVSTILFLSFIVIATVWFLFFSDFFSISKYEVGELRVLDRGAVAGEMDHFFDQQQHGPISGRNIFLFDPIKLEKFLKKTFFIENATVEKIYPNILRLTISERQRSVIFITNNQMLILDDYGIVTDKADETTVSSTRTYLSNPSPIESSKEIYIIAPTSTSYQIGYEYTSSEQVRSWLELAKKLRDAGIWFKAFELNLETPDILSVILKDNKNVLFDIKIVPDEQIETLRLFLQTKPNMDEINDYIDVRIPGRIYYK